MRRDQVVLPAPAVGGSGTVVVHGHWGRPVLVFPSEQGSASDFEDNGMVAAVADLVDGGKVKLYCVDSHDAATWSDRSQPLEERARRHAAYESWILDQVVPFVHDDCGGPREIATLGCSLGAYHALNFALRRADVFPLALCLSGSYDPAAWHGWGQRGDQAYFHNPVDYVPHLGGDHLDWLRSHVSVLLVCGRGRWEDTTGSLPGTLTMAAALREQGLRCELDLWGEEWPHDWPSWRAQLAAHLPRFC
ncbi:MAG: esterase [Streptosporangiales bacterium]|nr:esterase [Streptosporangiales bacterium]